MRPVPGARLTLVTKDLVTPYSGMLPGFVSGYYSYEDVHIDLCRLARFSQSRLIHAEATGVDVAKRMVLLRDRPSITYDVLSIDIGSIPSDSGVPGSGQYTTAVKPISTFINRFEKMLDAFKRSSSDRGFSLAIVGGGAGGVELAFSMEHRLTVEEAVIHQGSNHGANITILSKGPLLTGYPSSVRRMALTRFEQKGIGVIEDDPVVEVQDGRILLRSGRLVEFDGCLWCTQAAAAPWIAESALPTNKDGFIQTNNFLQLFNGRTEVFAVGDIATSVMHPRPKAGVFAVRQGPPLAQNIRRLLQGEGLIPFLPQTTYLSLISTGDKFCIASKGSIAWQGATMWILKDAIDRKFMDKYGRDLPDMEKMRPSPEPHKQDRAVNLLEKQAATLFEQSKKRCAGCGGKVGMGVLRRILDVIGGNVGYDDAAIIKPPPKGHLQLQTTDYLRSFLSDPYVFGQIAALHCIADIYAMGGRPTSLLTTAVVPFTTEEKMEADLIQVMMGVKKVCDTADCQIVGGHTAEGMDLALGLTVNGLVHDHGLLTKRGAGGGQMLVLTKAVGTGMILAADMKGKTKASWLEAAVTSMLKSNAPAVDIFMKHGATACTDVTGFGLLGHLSEMLRSGVSFELDWKSIPILPGVKTCCKNGWLSTLHPQNSRLDTAVENLIDIQNNEEFPAGDGTELIGGGLLALIPKERAASCVEALHSVGLTSAAMIGHSIESEKSGPPVIRILTEDIASKSN